MKKAVSVLIACVLVLSLVPLSASATVGGSGMSFSIGSATARQGGTVTVPISVSAIATEVIWVFTHGENPKPKNVPLARFCALSGMGACQRTDAAWRCSCAIKAA